MLLNRIYDDKDLERYRSEREQAMTKWRTELKTASVPDGLIESFAKQICDQVVIPPSIAGLEIVHTGIQAEQNFSTPLITEFIKLGVASIEGDQLALKAAPEDLHYTIKRTPGRWCLHCSEKLADDVNGELARLHVAMKHKDKPSPVESTPAGYEWLTYFECVLNEEQHLRYKNGA